jgi:hypothetical protein
LWLPFKSVGWCSKCEDRTSSTNISNCKLEDIILGLGRDDIADYCVLNLGHGANFSLIRNLRMSFDTDGARLDGNYTEEAIWPLSYGNSGAKLSVLQAPELSSGPTRLLGVLNPLIMMGHAIVELDAEMDGTTTRNYTNFNVLRVAEASQCILNPCEKTMSLTRINGTTTWKSDDESINFGKLIARNVPDASDAGFMTLCWQAEDGDLDLASFDNDEGRYAVDKRKRAFCPVEDYAYDIQKSLQGRKNRKLGFLVSGGFASSYLFNYTDEDEGFDYDYKIGRFNTVGPQATRTLGQRVENIAVALTNWGLQTTNDTWPGEAIAEEPFVRVRWQWFALPAFLELASLALLVLTIIQSRRENVPIWKSSALALIYHAVDELRGQETLATEQLSGMEVIAKTTDVQLVKGEDGVNSLSKRSGYRPVDQDG